MKLNSISIALMSLVGVLAAPAAFGNGISEELECYTQAAEGEQVCIMTPPDSVISADLRPKLHREGPTVSMLSERELSGQALEPVDLAGLDLDEDDATLTSPSIGIEAASISQSMKTQDQLRWIETFLKTGPSAGSPDIRVHAAAKPSK